MIFKLFSLLLLFLFFTSQAQAGETHLLGGKYKLDLTVLDSDLRYPVKFDFKISNTGTVGKVEINYPSFKCRAEKKSIRKQENSFNLQEKLTLGQHICEASGYKFIPFFEPDYIDPSKGIFKAVLNLTEGQEIKTVIHSVSFLPTQTTAFFLNNGLKNWVNLKSSGNLKLLNNFTVNAPDSEYYPDVVSLIYNLTEQKNTIGLYVDFLERYQLEPYRKKVITNLVSLYRKQDNMESYYKAYLLAGAMQDLKDSLLASKTAKALDDFLKKNPQINQVAGIDAIKLEAYRDKNSFDGYLKAFEISQFRDDIKKAFKLVQDKGQKYQAEKALGLFLSRLTVDSKQCLSGDIDEKTRDSYKTLTSICDTPERETRINAICFAVSFGGCDAISTQAIDNPVLQAITTNECRKQISRMTVEDPELADLNALVGTDIVAMGRKIALDSNDIVKFFFGMPLAITEVIPILISFYINEVRQN